LQQLGLVLQMAGPERVGKNLPGWPQQLAPRLDGANVLHCPDDVSVPTNVSYGISSRLTLLSTADSGKIVALDYGQTVANVVGLQGNDDWPALMAPRHRGALNVLFLGGHVQRMSPEAIDPRVCEVHDTIWRPAYGAITPKANCPSQIQPIVTASSPP
jgi:prepilin-type processing-associated H-X9-DG protein